MTIPPNIGWEGVSLKGAFNGTSFTQTRTLAQRFGGDVVNVLEMGPVDTPAHQTATLQAAIDAAFPDPADPTQNKILYIPKCPTLAFAGRYSYQITTPLYMHNVTGGVVVGDGPGNTVLDFLIPGGPTFPGNAYTGDGSTPMLICDNVNTTRFEGMTFNGEHFYNDLGCTGIYFFCSSGGTCDRNMLVSIAFGDGGVGVQLGGAGSDQLVRGTVILNCPNNLVKLAHVRVLSSASTGHVVINGGCAESGRLHEPAPDFIGQASTYVPGTSVGNGMAIYSNQNGQIAAILGQSFSGNGNNFLNASSYPMSIIGCRDEMNYFGQSCMISTNSPVTGGAGGPVFVAEYVLSGGSNTMLLATDDVTHGQLIPVDPVTRPQTNMLDAFNHGRFHVSGITYNCHPWNSGVSPVFGAIGKVDATSSIMVDTLACEGYDTDNPRKNTAIPPINTLELTGGFEGAGTVYLRGLAFSDSLSVSGAYAGWWPVMNFAGSFVTATNAPVAFATTAGLLRGLPPAGAQYEGTRFLLTNSPTTAVSSNFWATVTVGGGANTVPVFCDGTNWRIA